MLKIDSKKIWTASLVFYIICSTAFSYGVLKPLNTISLYLFFAVSIFCILARGAFRLNFVVVSLVLYGMIMALGMFYTPAPDSQATKILYYYITMAVLAVCVVQYIREIKDVETIMFAYMLAGLAMAIYVYALYGSSLLEILQANAEEEAQYIGRFGKELTNVNTISLCTAVSAIIGVYYLIFSRTSVWKTVLSAVTVVFCFVISMAAASKKSLILIVVCFFAMFLYNALGSRRIFKHLLGLIFTLAVIFGLIYLIMNHPMFSGIAARFEDLFDFMKGEGGTGSEKKRFEFVQRGLQVFWDHIFFGSGTSSSFFYFATYSHNNFVEVLMNSGLVGFGVFYFGHFIAAYRYLKNPTRYKENSKIFILLFALFVGITVCSMAIVYYYDRYYMILLTAAFSATGIVGKESAAAHKELGS